MDEHLAILGHDLRNELSTIAGLAELLEFAGKDPEIKAYAQQIRSHGQFMLDLVHGLVVSAKAGGLQPTLAAVAPWTLAADVIAGAAVSPTRAPVALTAVGTIPERIVSDGLMLRQVLTNLMGNAVRFTRDGGVRLQLEYIPDAGQMFFTVTDTGPGMSSDQIGRLFLPDRTLQREEAAPGGHGLGLWIARSLVDRLGGAITVRSLLGHGTMVTVRVPAAPVEGARLLNEAELRDQMVTRKSLGMTARESLAGFRVLVADDVPANRLIAATLLKRRGAGVTLAVDGVEAVRLAQEAQAGGRPFDIMLFDYHMPNMDGAQAAGVLRKGGCATPILCWTAASSPSISRLPDAFTTVMDKPIESERFYAMVSRFAKPVGMQQAHGGR